MCVRVRGGKRDFFMWWPAAPVRRSAVLTHLVVASCACISTRDCSTCAADMWEDLWAKNKQTTKLINIILGERQRSWLCVNLLTSQSPFCTPDRPAASDLTSKGGGVVCMRVEKLEEDVLYLYTESHVCEEQKSHIHTCTGRLTSSVFFPGV